MNIYEARWNKAKALAQDIIDRMEDCFAKCGKHAMVVRDGETLNGRIVIYDDQIIFHDEAINIIMFADNPDEDTGSHSTIKEIEELFKEFEVYEPWQIT